MKKVTIPKYTLGEELVNSISHGIGILLGITALVLTVISSAKNHNTIGVVSSCIYGSTMIVMYSISCIYHALSLKLKAKKSSSRSRSLWYLSIHCWLLYTLLFKFNRGSDWLDNIFYHMVNSNNWYTVKRYWFREVSNTISDYIFINGMVNHILL